jgi:hypothetical protein
MRQDAQSAELKLGYELVFTITNYYDGPRQGIAMFGGQPHFYDCIFSDENNDYSDLFRLTPVRPAVFELAMEDWEIWCRWEQAFRTGRVTMETHPALPEERGRYEEIKCILDFTLVTDIASSVIRKGQFEVLGTELLSKDVMRTMQVLWT